MHWLILYEKRTGLYYMKSADKDILYTVVSLVENCGLSTVESGISMGFFSHDKFRYDNACIK